MDKMASFLLLLFLSIVQAAPSPKQSEFDLLMPEVQPQETDTYLCRAVKVEDGHKYLTGFKPHANSEIAHHILLYGCAVPGGSIHEVWNCGEMVSKQNNYKSGSVCAEGNNIIYAWAMDAPSLTLPDGVSFDVGQNTPIKYLVVQVHYKNVEQFKPPNNHKDSSGLTITTSPVPTPRKAGVYLMLTDGYIPSHSIEYFEVACPMTEDVELFPFGFRTHAHPLGRVISGYRVRNNTWEEIGRKDPRLPEMFYNVTSPGMNIQKGDILAARCTMENTLDKTVAIGSTQKDEMCNFYIMYYVERSKLLKQNSCFSLGPPEWYWSNYDGLNLDNVPKTVSVIPGSDHPLIRNATYLPSPRYSEDTNLDNLEDETEVIDNIDPQVLEAIVRNMEEEEQRRELFSKWQREAIIPDYFNGV